MTRWLPGLAHDGLQVAVFPVEVQQTVIIPPEALQRDLEAELAGLEPELRSLSQGMAQYETHFDHLAELSGKLANGVIQRTPETV